MKWSEERQPNEQVRYNHVLCETPLGLASIEWKGWKEDDYYVGYIDGDFIGSWYTLDDAKHSVRQYLETKSCELDDFLLEEIK